MNRRSMLLLAASACVGTASVVGAAPAFTNSGQSVVYTVSNSDLLQAAGTTHVNTDAGNVIADGASQFNYSDSGASVGVSALTNGDFGANGTPPNSDFAGIRGPAAGGPLNITYTLDTSANTSGYDLSAINAYTGWGDSGRSELKFTVSYSTVASPNTFVALGSDDFNIGNNNQASLADNGGGLLATGVKSVQFTFPAQENAGAGWRELDVLGTATSTPEPASLSVLALAGLGLLTRRRRA